MIKNLLSLALLSSMAIGANAYGVDDMIYTRAAKYKVTAANLVTNGELKGASLDGWTATDATAAGLSDVFTVLEDGGVSVNAGMNALTNGMYQVVNISEGGTYVVTMKVRGAEPGYTDVDLFAAGDNYIFAYFNTDGTLSTAGGEDNKVLSYGENGSAEENCYSFTNEDFTEFAFPVKAKSDGKIVIDLRGLTAGIEIKNIECHKVESVVDERVAQARLAWIKYILDGFEWTNDYEYYADVVADVAALEDAIKNNGDIETFLSNLNEDFNTFAEANLSNVFNTVNGGGAGNDSPNWMKWTGHFDKLIQSYNGASGWTWTTDRWGHKQDKVDGVPLSEENVPMQIQWMRAASGTWDNIATLPCTLDKGTYFYSVEGRGGMMTKNKNRWARNSGYECAATQIFLSIDGAATAADTLDCGMLPTTVYKAYINKYTIAEDSKVNVGIRCNQSLDVINGFDVNFSNPVLYKVLVKGELTPEQKTYLSNVEVQIAATENLIKEAEELVAATQTEKPWGKDNLQKGIDEAKKRVEVWKKFDQKALLNLMDEGKATYKAENTIFYVENEYITKDSLYSYEALGDVIMNAGVRYLKNEFINVFNALNTPLIDMPDAIAAAEQTLAVAMYTSGDKATFSAIIKKAKDLYATQKAAQYTAEGSQALVDAKAELAKGIDDFIASVKMEYLVDIDFSKTYTETPPAEEGEDPTYSIEGTKGKIDILGTFSKDMQTDWQQYAFGLGFNNVETQKEALFFGKGDAKVDIDYAPKNNDVVILSFDIYYGYLGNGKKFPKYVMDFGLLNANGDTIGYYSRNWDIASEKNTLNIDESKFSCIGGKNNGNVQGNICTENNRTHFEIYLNYTDKNISVATTYKGAKTVNEAVQMSDGDNVLKKIIFSSNYTNGERCCWLDNVKVSVINDVPAAGTTGINEVASVAKASKVIKAIENGKLVIKTDKGTFNAVGVQIK